MKKYIAMRAVSLANYILWKNGTIREVAKKHKLGKTTVHKDITIRLPKIRPDLFEQILLLLETNKKERGLRGGSANKKRLERIRKKNETLSQI